MRAVAVCADRNVRVVPVDQPVPAPWFEDLSGGATEQVKVLLSPLAGSGAGPAAHQR